MNSNWQIAPPIKPKPIRYNLNVNYNLPSYKSLIQMIDLIQAATLSQSNQARQEAQKQLLLKREQNTQQFFIQVMEISTEEKVAPNIRLSSLVLLSTSILAKSGSNYFWNKLSTGAKQSIKDKILNILISSDRQIRRAAANVVAAICCIEIPNNEWPGIISTMSQNVKHQQIQIQEVSILCLGFICQRLKSKGYSFPSDMQQTILTAIILGIQNENEEIKNTALKALRDAIFSMSNILENKQYRDFLVKTIVDIINNPKIRSLGLQILTQFAKHLYSHLGTYIAGLYNILQPIIINPKEQNSCILAMQFWQTVASQYGDLLDEGQKVNNYITGQVGMKVIKVLLQNLCIIQRQSEQDDNPIRQSAYRTLSSISQCGAQEFKNIFLQFTSNTIKHQDWKFRQASIVSFSILLKGLPQEKGNNLLNSALIQLLMLLQDKTKFVQYTAIYAVSQIAQTNGICFLVHSNFLQILKLIMSKLNISENYLRWVCITIKNLCKVAKNKNLSTFSAIADDLIAALIQSTMKQESSLESLNQSMLAIMSLIQTCKNSTVCLKYIDFCLTNFVNLKAFGKEKQSYIQSGFLIIIHSSLIHLRNQAVEPIVLEKIFNFVIQTFRAKNDVTSDGIYVIGALSQFVRDPKFLDSFWPYIQHALKKFKQPELFKATLFSISEFIRKFDINIVNKLSFINPLIQLLQENDISRETKLDLLICLGQTFLYCRREVISYLNSFMGVCFLYCDGALQMVEYDFNFSQEVKHCLIEVFTCVVHGLCSQGNPCQQLIPYLQKIFHFIKLSVDKKNRPTINFIKNALLLVADIKKFYQHQVDKFVKAQYVYQSLEHLQKFNQNNIYTDIIDYVKEQMM